MRIAEITWQQKKHSVCELYKKILITGTKTWISQQRTMRKITRADPYLVEPHP